jgi:hypothetical protein
MCAGGWLLSARFDGYGSGLAALFDMAARGARTA